MTDRECNELALRIAENNHNVTSASSIAQLAVFVSEELRDEGIKPRKTLVLYIAKLVKLHWLNTIQRTKASIQENG